MVQLAVVHPSVLANPLAGWKMTIVLCWLSVFFVAVTGLELRTSHTWAKYSDTEQLLLLCHKIRVSQALLEFVIFLLWFLE